MSIRTTWSGGATWSGTAKWMPDGSPTGPFPMVHVSIGGTLIEGLQSADWGLGPTDWLAPLSPASGSFVFAGSLSVSPRDQIVVTCPAGALWVGYVDTVNAMRDVDGAWFTTVSAADSLARLGTASELSVFTPTDGTTAMEMAVQGAFAAGTVLSVADQSSGLPDLDYSGTQYKGSVVDFMNRAFKSSNAMAAAQRDGSVLVLMREALPGSGINGTFEVNTTGWSGYTGGSIARSTTTPISGVADAQVTAIASQYSGAVYPITGTFKAGVTYRLSATVQAISGETDWYIQCYGSYDSSPFTSFVATGTATVQTSDFTPDVDVTDMEVYVGVIDGSPSAGVLAMDDVTVTVAPVDVDGRIGVWATNTSAETDINVWYDSTETTIASDLADLADLFARGLRAYVEDTELVRTLGAASEFIYDDWIVYGGEARPLASGELVTDSWADADILLLDPFDWITVDGTDWQVMSLRHTITLSPPSWRVNVTADTFLSLL